MESKNTDTSKNPAVLPNAKKTTAVTAKDTAAAKCSSSTTKTAARDACKSDDDDDIQIIDQEQVHFAPLKMSCAHINLNPNLCPKMMECKNKACALVHTLSPMLGLTFCPAYLKTGGCSEPKHEAAAEPHLDMDQLQEHYRQAIRVRVLNCQQCFFKCKFFNPRKKKYRQNRICFKDFTSHCRNKKECVFIHFEELRHLDLMPPCKIFAVREMCPSRSTEKGVLHLTHQKYQNLAFEKMNNNDGRCKTCLDELEKHATELSNKIKQFFTNSTDTEEMSSEPVDMNKSSKNDDMSRGPLDGASPAPSSSQAEAATQQAPANNDANKVVPSGTESIVSADSKSAPCLPSAPPPASRMMSKAPLSPLTKFREQSRSPSPAVIPSHSRLPPVLTPSSGIQIKSRTVASDLSKHPSSAPNPNTDSKKAAVGESMKESNVDDEVQKKNTKSNPDDACCDQSGADVSRNKYDASNNQNTEQVSYKMQSKPLSSDKVQSYETKETLLGQEDTNKPSGKIDYDKNATAKMDKSCNEPDLHQSTSAVERDKHEINSNISSNDKQFSGKEKTTEITADKASEIEVTDKDSNQSLSKESISGPKANTNIEKTDQKSNNPSSSHDRTKTTEKSVYNNSKYQNKSNASSVGNNKLGNAKRAYHAPTGPHPYRGGRDEEREYGGGQPLHKTRRVCPFFGTATKCKSGRNCPDIHDISMTICRFWRGGYCMYGNKCVRRHVR
eukprot:TRINITY_DN11862_c0_g2_i5.p1 TRINITY_DN11862_c0_g2~~TRINITY_DN11862_c0_g2_i5.p1  ORF type:complete len:726 (+),score=145.55 TRINITY_DN11862_c0_g2_i5:391-2568(+)